jgi:hypothetical protein
MASSANKREHGDPSRKILKPFSSISFLFSFLLFHPSLLIFLLYTGLYNNTYSYFLIFFLASLSFFGYIEMFKIIFSIGVAHGKNL